jgi:hypothetical protein
MSVASVLGPADGLYDLIWAYSPSDLGNPWKGCFPNMPSEFSEFTAFEVGRGYWIHMTGNCSVPVSGVPANAFSITLRAGWNLVGYPTLNSTVTLSRAVWATYIDRTETFDPADPCLLQVLAYDHIMRPGHGYWMRATADTIWTVDW